MKKTPPRDSAAASPLDALPVFIARLHHAFPAFIEQLGRGTKLAGRIKPGMGTVLLALLEEDGCRVRELAQRLHLRNATLTGLLDRLETEGLVRREPCPEDGRALRVRLTAQGRKLRPVVHELHARGTLTLEAGFTARQLVLLKSLLGRVLENLRAQEPERSAVESRRAADRRKPGVRR